MQFDLLLAIWGKDQEEVAPPGGQKKRSKFMLAA